VAAAAAAAAVSAGRGGSAGSRLSGFKNSVSSNDNPPDRLAGFRMLCQGGILHALLDLKMTDRLPLLLRNRLINVGCHARSISQVQGGRQPNGRLRLGDFQTRIAMVRNRG